MAQLSKELSFRAVVQEDAPILKQWLMDPVILHWFPMVDEREVDDAVRIWINYSLTGAGIVAILNGAVCGFFNLYIQPFKKVAHTTLLSVIVDPDLRGKGIGYAIMREGERLAKEKCHIEILHLEVYEGNPAQKLYTRLGYKVYGRQDRFTKENGTYRAKILMEKALC
ncbi:MAG: GNAT family N-acetyltransferase [Chlamydiae bacterium]|nr:GNAT family N-acetyltransferase [Chlamydiota bacterium]